MAKIKVNELNPAGTELFTDSESFINELNESESINQINGGRGGHKPTNIEVNPYCA
ncbi:MAG: hypothetical protein F6K10_27990 [Moorea sp. SIO2B7]|nr:hypothetical protein [Moorena sp. SIO2B7]